MSTEIAQRYVGTSVARSEDPRILTGGGTYVDDVKLPGMVYAAFHRSPFPHAKIVSVDASAAREAEGVLLVYTGEELEELITPGPYGIAIMMNQEKPVFTCLATDKVRLVGDPVALVVAETRYLAEDASELIDVEYEDLPPVATYEQAFDPANPPIFEDLGSNVLMESDVHTHGDVEGAFSRADHVLSVRISQHRHQNVPMETRGIVASYDREADQFVIWSANQGVHQTRHGISARLGIDPEKVRVRTADVGGSFGLKLGASREDVAVTAASMALGRPVKYIEDRYENLTFSGQAREEYLDVEAAYTDDGDILGMKVHMVLDGGAYPGLAGALPSMVEGMFPSAYKIGALQFRSTLVATNKATYVAYRGPWAAETFVRERVVDLIARELGKDPFEIRMRNVVTRGEEPTAMVTGRSLEGVTVRESLERVAELVDIPAFRVRQEAARAEGRYLGLGMASYIEAAPGPKPGQSPLGLEQMRMEIDENGKLVVFTGQMPHGQSHQTTLAQIAADEFGVRFEDVQVVVGDTDVVPPGFTGGSRSATMAGGAALTTARALRAKVLEVGSHLLEANVSDMRIEDGELSVVGVPASAMSLAAVAAAAREPGRLPDDVEPELKVEKTYDGGAGGWSGGTHCAIVEVDIETGLVRFDRYVVAEDCGKLINPAVVDGQVRGGIAQGIGAVLLERSAYDDRGNFLAATFMDYLMPTTVDIPNIEISHLETIPLDPDVNFRGVGEGGMIVTPPAVVNAIEDALAPFGVRIYQQHLPPAKILELAGVVEPE
jgi:carbon-monoxide dehydrogenase large subunit